VSEEKATEEALRRFKARTAPEFRPPDEPPILVIDEVGELDEAAIKAVGKRRP